MTATRAPARLRLRPYRGEPDLVEIARILNAEAEADALPDRFSREELAAEYGHPNEHFEPTRDVTIAELDGQPVAVAYRMWVETTDGYREYRMDGAVDPAWRRRGIGSALAAENERRSRALAAKHGPGRPVLGSWSWEHQRGHAAIMQAAGFEPVRWFFHMVRPTLDVVPDIALPDGLEVRPITSELVRQVWLADVEAFEDHWGGFDRSDEQLDRWLADPSTDLSLWVVVFDGGEVAGGSLNVISETENEMTGLRRGWLASVFTRRPWRRRGVARAVIARSLAALRERGMTSAALGVDADNPNGALGLYEALGFEVEKRATAWRKALES
ncbi:MAG TPA: GNAT family N-acetyltransferase [Candidatus Deferrimicrobiaceae bacterium]|nr:GNAT family N-acetyltransferase [Candidatus Deferrimicrobiaceae bacterium]